MTLHTWDWQALSELAARLTCAFALGALIGFERQLRQRTAGLRTNTLVALGAAIFVSLGTRLFEQFGGAQTPIHIVAYVVSGIGFLGAGAIMKEGANISGLNTAATLWGSGAVGACAGAGLPFDAAIAALFVLAGNTLLRPVVSAINRRPFAFEQGEAEYFVHLICQQAQSAELREQLSQQLQNAGYPARELSEQPFDKNETEISATLYATAVQAEELNQLMTQLEALEGVSQAFWHGGNR